MRSPVEIGRTVLVSINVHVPAALRRDIRATAIAEGITVQEWVTAALVEELERRRTLDP